jgi:predicted HTH domain antitoxin
MFGISEDLVKKELKVIQSTGFYRDEEEFIKEAINTLLATRKDLRVSVACELYKRDEISLGKACEIASLNIEEMKEVLYKRGIRRSVNVSSVEMESMAKKAMRTRKTIGV